MARAEIRDLRCHVEALKLSKFVLERFSTDNDSIKFYTGFPSYNHLVTFYELVETRSETMQYWYSVLRNECQRSLSFCSLVFSSKLCAIFKVTGRDYSFADLLLSKQIETLFSNLLLAPGRGGLGK